MGQAFRASVVAQIQDKLSQQSQIHCLWLGGSSATAQEDEYSDTDLVIVADNHLAAFELVENHLRQQYQLQHIWDIGFNQGFQCFQKFYVIAPAPEFYYLDVVVFTQKEPSFFAEYFNHPRHGEPVVLFDKIHLLDKAREEMKPLEGIRSHWPNTLAQFEVMYRSFGKEAKRHKYIDSVAFYMRLVAILVQQLRIKHSPQRHDFGLRYLNKDLPSQEAELIERLFKFHDIASLNANAQLIREKMLQLSRDA